MNSLRKSLVTIVLATVAALATAPAGAADPRALISEAEVTIAGVKSYFDAAFFSTSIDSDGDLVVTDGGIKTAVAVNNDSMILTFISIWPLKKSVEESKKLKFVNSLNDDLLMVRFALTKTGRLYCDYQMKYEGGVTPYMIINTYRTFVKVVRGAAQEKDPDDIIGSDG
ncbi:MAG: YbjN domain-containing protein [Deferrisomatales bacterium]